MVRTRFAPSPTGFLHVGGLRTALYAYLFAKKHGGDFLLRIEDTDQKRTVEGGIENLIRTLHWGNLPYDEGPQLDGSEKGSHGPYIQSKRTDLYRKYAYELVSKGHAYLCFCTSDRLEEMRKMQEAHKQAPKYDRRCMSLSTAEIESLKKAGTPYVIRQKIPDAGSVSWNDLVRGDVSFESSTIDDQVLIKSDGFPTYHLANVVDDHHMEITHVIRGEEWLSSTPKHLLLYRAFGLPPPEFAHLPLLLNKDRSKLSKRQGDVAVEDYKNKGYLPEALVNFVALLGWHPGGDETAEIFSLSELVEKFTLEKVHKGGAVFDLEKLDWVNWQWRRRKFEEQPGEMSDKLSGLCGEFLPADYKKDPDLLKRALVTVAEKVIKEPKSAPEQIQFYFNDNIQADPALICREKMNVTPEIARQALTAVAECLATFTKWDDLEALKAYLTELVQKLGLKNGQVFWPTRVALTGEEFSPGVFEVLWVLGQKQSITRISRALTGL